MSLNSNTESMQELLDEANALPTEEDVYERGFVAGRQTDTTLTQSGVPADAKATGDSIGQVRTYLGKIADYPVEIGTEESTDGYAGTWYWKKYDSGEARCYGRFDYGSVACTTSWGDSGFRESAGMYKTFPANLFIDVPLHLDISLMDGSGAAFITQDRGSDMTAGKTGRFTLSRPSSMTLTNVSLGFEVIGRWK